MDELIRAITSDGLIKAVAITSTAMTERARQIHRTLPNATAALGRALAAASMIGNMQKIEDGSVTLQFRGGGPLGLLMAVSDARGNVRGYVENPGVPIMEKRPGKLDVGAALGTDGMLTVIRDLRMKEPYIGSVRLVSGEIAEDVTAYFAESEQTPTACALGVRLRTDASVETAGGLLLQLLPGAPEGVIGALERGIARAGSVTEMACAGHDARGMLGAVLTDFSVEFFPAEKVEYHCGCTRERMRSAILCLGREELSRTVEVGETLHVDCRFCDRVHDFTPADLKEILRSL